MEIRELSAEEFDFISGGSENGRSWRFIEDRRVNNEKFCYYANVNTGNKYQYSAGFTDSACYPGRTTVSGTGVLTNTSPARGHVFEGGRATPFPSWGEKFIDMFSWSF